MCLAIVFRPPHEDLSLAAIINEYAEMHVIDVSDYENPLRLGDNDNTCWYIWRINNGW